LRRLSGHGHAASSPELEEPLVSERVERPKNGVRVHTEDGRKISRRRKPISGTSLTFGDGSAEGAGHLFVQRDRALVVDLRDYFSPRHTRNIRAMSTVGSNASKGTSPRQTGKRVLKLGTAAWAFEPHAVRSRDILDAAAARNGLRCLTRRPVEEHSQPRVGYTGIPDGSHVY
jgi:hypothetical protein